MKISHVNERKVCVNLRGNEGSIEAAAALLIWWTKFNEIAA